MRRTTYYTLWPIDGIFRVSLQNYIGFVFKKFSGPPQPTVRKCPGCGSDMTLRQKSSSTSSDQQQTQTQTQTTPGGQSKKMSYYIGCMGYPQCRNVMWLPRQILDINVLDQSCHRVSLFCVTSDICIIIVYTYMSCKSWDYCFIRLAIVYNLWIDGHLRNGCSLIDYTIPNYTPFCDNTIR